MSRLLAAGVLSIAAGLAPTPAGSAQTHAGLVIEPRPVDCVVARQFPKIAACIRPAAEVARALLYFRARGRSEWYYVSMSRRAGEPCFEGVLPKPRPETTALEYYFEAYSGEMGDSRTEERQAVVVGGREQCAAGVLASGASSAAVTVVAPAGAPAVPPGFSPMGVSAAKTASATAADAAKGSGAAGGGAATKVLIVAGGVAAVGGAALGISGGSGGDASNAGGSSPTTTTLAPAAPPAAQPAGPAVTIGFAGSNPAPGASVRDPGGTFTMNLAVTVSVQCSVDVANGRLFVMLRRAGTTCVVSYADFSLAAGASRTVTVTGFVAQAACRPAPFAVDTVFVPVYDMNASATLPLGTASFAVGYSVVP
jgi:hypothetical protein